MEFQSIWNRRTRRQKNGAVYNMPEEAWVDWAVHLFSATARGSCQVHFHLRGRVIGPRNNQFLRHINRANVLAVMLPSVKRTAQIPSIVSLLWNWLKQRTESIHLDYVYRLFLLILMYWFGSTMTTTVCVKYAFISKMLLIDRFRIKTS